jgi:hypothetical protein
MKTKSGSCSAVSRTLQTMRFKSAQVVAISLLATLKLMAQNQSASAPPVDAGAGAPAPGTSPQSVPPTDATLMPPPMLQAPKATKNEISVSGDVMFGEGTVTLPLGYSLKQSLGGSVPTPLSAFSVPRNSIYFGGTVSYSYGQAWYVDASYSKGQSSGSQSINTGFLGALDSSFSIDDTWYQLYIKYTFPQLRGKRFSAYLRAGASYVTADITDDAQSPAAGRYHQTDTTDEYLGNIGFGLGYSLYTSGRLRLGVQFEGEGFYGERSQQSLENLSADAGLDFVSAGINNSLYGGIGRVTMRAEYRLGQSGLFKIFGEVGAEGWYTLIDYSGAGSSNELLWGPYAKLGIRYAF